MKLVIDIDEDYYKIICKRVKEPFHSSYEQLVISDGKPLKQCLNEVYGKMITEYHDTDSVKDKSECMYDLFDTHL